MRRLIALLFAFFIILLLVPSISLAQEFTFNKSYEDYTFIYSQYRQSYTEYEKAKTAYINSKNSATEKDAIEKTKVMLSWRNKTIAAYLTSLRMKLSENKGLSDQEKQVKLGKIDEEITWFNNQFPNLEATSGLPDLFSFSSIIENRYAKTSQPIALQTIGYVSLGKEKYFRDLIKAEAEKISEQIKLKREGVGGRSFSAAENWLSDANARLSWLPENFVVANMNIGLITGPKETDKIEYFRQAVKPLTLTRQFLKESVDFLQKATKEIQ
jgi:hypothetical protein